MHSALVSHSNISERNEFSFQFRFYYKVLGQGHETTVTNTRSVL